MMENLSNQKPLMLLGMMGCGKSHIGRVLSEKRGMRFADMDALIEDQEGASVADIFDAKGEAYFRDLESALLMDLVRQNDVVISSGGGVVLSDANREVIRDHAFSVWIKSDIDVLFNRLKSDTTRPLLRSDNLRERLAELIDKRSMLYSVADIHIDNNENGDEAVLNVVEAIIAAYKEHVLKA